MIYFPPSKQVCYRTYFIEKLVSVSSWPKSWFSQRFSSLTTCCESQSACRLSSRKLLQWGLSAGLHAGREWSLARIVPYSYIVFVQGRGGKVTSFIQFQNTSCNFISAYLANNFNFSYFSMYLNTFKLLLSNNWVYLIKRIIPYSVLHMYSKFCFSADEFQPVL